MTYHADAVHFGTINTLLSVDTVSCTDGSSFAFVIWLKKAVAFDKQVWTVNPQNTDVTMFHNFGVSHKFRCTLSDEEDDNDFNCDSVAGPSLDVWHSVVFSATTNLSAGNKKVKLYIDDADVSVPGVDGSAAFITALNGLQFALGDDTFGDGQVMDIADCRVMANTNLMDGSFDIPVATRRLFVTADNKPVDPATATAALGTPTILFSGDATAFLVNQGSGGAATLTGSLTNASTSPSGPVVPDEDTTPVGGGGGWSLFGHQQHTFHPVLKRKIKKPDDIFEDIADAMDELNKRK